MAEFDFRDFYIGYKSHPRFTINKIIVDDIIRVIVQKYEMILFTNKGELLGDPDFGCDLEKLLFETKISAYAVKQIINQQIGAYIPELINTNYTLDVTFEEDPENYQDVMIVKFTITDYEVVAIIS
jgi:phage baseplate assembly protein W